MEMRARPLRVGVDLTAIWRQPTGIFRYAMELAQHLLLLEEAAEPMRYTFFFAREVHKDFQSLPTNVEVVVSPFVNEMLIKQVWFPWILPRLGLDVMHYPSFPPPYVRIGGPRMVMTLHDAGPWRYPGTLTLHGRLYFQTLLARGLRSCERVITVSRHARAEIAHFQGERFMSKVEVISQAASENFAFATGSALRQETQQRYGLPERYFFTVSTLEPRKNLETLLTAYQRLRTRLGQACPPLVIVGRKGWNCADILGQMASLEESVIFPGHVSDAELVALYQMATCFVFPSLYEGFGLPVLEAMLAGCPVITSNLSSLPEVAGDAALLVDPLDVTALAGAMERVAWDERLRSRLANAGQRRAAAYSWLETARQTREVYRQAAGRSRDRAAS